MSKYLAFFRMKFINGLQYRAAAYAGVATQFAWGFMEILAFAAFYRANPAAFPMTFSQTAAYIWLQQAFLGLLASWTFNNEVFDAIMSGSVAYGLCRPLSMYKMWFTSDLADRTAKAVLRCMPILLVAVLLPEPIRLATPANLTCLALFVISMVLTTFLEVAFAMLIYISTFYTLSAIGMRILAISFIDLLSGMIVPLPFFPNGIRQVAEVLPFAYMQNIPLRIYSGNISGSTALVDIAMQAVWLVVIGVGGSLWMQKALKRVVLQGG